MRIYYKFATAILSLAIAAWSQTTATIVGTVTDPSGAIVPNVSITVISEDTGLTRKAVTSQSGNYAVPLLPVGDYSVTAEAAGFKKKTTTGIVLQVNQEPRVDIVLEVGAITDTVTVSAEAVRAADRERRRRPGDRQPLHHADPAQRPRFLAACCCCHPEPPPGPEASIARSGSATGSSGSGIAIGGRDSQNNFTLDGASNNARQFGNIAMQALHRRHPGVQSADQLLHGGPGAGRLWPDQPDHQIRHQQPARLAVRILAQQRVRCAQHVSAQDQPPEPQPVRRSGGRPHPAQQEFLLRQLRAAHASGAAWNRSAPCPSRRGATAIFPASRD